MLTFGTEEKLETLDFMLAGDDTVYHLPLGKGMPFSQIRKLATVAAIKDPDEKSAKALEVEGDILRTVLGDKVDNLPVGIISEIFDAWNKASSDNGAELGE